MTEMTNILDAPSPPPPKLPKTPDENPNMLTIGPIDTENPTDEDIEMLEKVSFQSSVNLSIFLQLRKISKIFLSIKL